MGGGVNGFLGGRCNPRGMLLEATLVFFPEI